MDKSPLPIPWWLDHVYTPKELPTPKQDRPPLQDSLRAVWGDTGRIRKDDEMIAQGEGSQRHALLRAGEVNRGQGTTALPCYAHWLGNGVICGAATA